MHETNSFDSEARKEARILRHLATKGFSYTIIWATRKLYKSSRNVYLGSELTHFVDYGEAGLDGSVVQYVLKNRDEGPNIAFV